ncbi:phosphotransferase [Cupriavidus sp. IDO]|uniref:phosphotransferase n=1 Tax=Cupriavidus sp. IDO TaxID=1539142 RepID=UPI0005793AAB|nr:phosphotransferase [Cupriavidus sp. IDO]KWR88602.1 aminoglycoside phosphotransferase [Cupriavidus sp. IDO]
MNTLREDQVDNLACYLRQEGLIAHDELQVQRLAGGQSNPTYRMSSGGRQYVLRTKPPGQLLSSAHAIDREHRVLHALQRSEVPVPAVYNYCDDAGVIGTPFYLMEFLEGRVFVDQTLPGMSREQRREIYAEMSRVVSALHRVDHVAAGLSDYGKGTNYLARQIERWSRQCTASPQGCSPELEALTRWLPAHLPPGEATGLVHGDFRMDNLVFHPTEARVIGVLDWELSTLGHPLVDFAYHCLSWHITPSLWRGIAGLDLEALGIPDESTYLRWYEASTGAQALAHWDFYIAYNLFRLAAIMHGIGQRVAAGNAAAHDAAETASKSGPLAELAWKYASRHEAAVHAAS